jgi:alpha-glucoside transport system substrate-binding protein
MNKRIRIVAAVSAVAVAALGFGSVAAAEASTPTVTIFGAFSGDQARGFQGELNSWGLSNGVNVKYTGLANFNTDITVKVNGGQAPDIALWPQPGGLLGISSKLKPLASIPGFNLSAVQKTLIPGWDKLAVKSGKIYGLPIGANVKSLVWYNPAAFRKAGYKVPTTDAQLTTLVAKIKSDASGYPYCAGIESGGATGWYATDWLEEYVLKYGGVANYNKWWQGQIHFNSTLVKQAANKVASALLTPGNVQGGGTGIASRNFGEATTTGLFVSGKNNGQCFMLKQGSFITDFFPSAIKAEYKAGNYSHVGFFPVPTPAGGVNGVLGGGDIAGVFHSTPAVAKVLNFILSDKLGRAGWANSGFFLSAHKTFPNSLYPTSIQRAIGKTLATASAFGFDGSDAEPAVVNSTEWTQLTSWFNGSKTLTQALTAIDAAY